MLYNDSSTELYPTQNNLNPFNVKKIISTQCHIYYILYKNIINTFAYVTGFMIDTSFKCKHVIIHVYLLSNYLKKILFHSKS